MRVVQVVVVLLLLLAVSCSAYFNGKDVSPSNNPIVDKYHSSVRIGNDGYFEKSILYHIIPGVVVGSVLFIFAALYFAYRWCRCCFKCCKRNNEDGFKPKHNRSRRDVFSDEKKEYHLSHPVVSVVLRVILVVLFLTVTAGIVIGFLGSSEFHTSLLETLQIVDSKATQINTTLYDTSQLMSTLTAVNISIPQEYLETLQQTGNTIADDANTLNTAGPKYDGIRNTVTMALYFVVAIPLLLGLIGALAAKGKFAYAMSVMLPLGILVMWLAFSLHYAIFVVNVDVCYSVDTFLVGTDGNEQNPLSFIMDCTNTSLVDTVLDFINEATNQTEVALSHANSTYANILTNQLAALDSIDQDLKGLIGCSAVSELVTGLYTNLCGGLVQASMFLWQSQVVVATVLTVAFVIGLLSEYRIARKKKEDGYNPLLLLNEDE